MEDSGHPRVSVAACGASADIQIFGCPGFPLDTCGNNKRVKYGTGTGTTGDGVIQSPRPSDLHVLFLNSKFNTQH